MAGRTLYEMAHRRVVIQAVCRTCRHEALIYPLDVGPTLGWGLTADDIQERLRCSACGSTAVKVYEASR